MARRTSKIDHQPSTPLGRLAERMLELAGDTKAIVLLADPDHDEQMTATSGYDTLTEILADTLTHAQGLAVGVGLTLDYTLTPTDDEEGQ